MRRNTKVGVRLLSDPLLRDCSAVQAGTGNTNVSNFGTEKENNQSSEPLVHTATTFSS